MTTNNNRDDYQLYQIDLIKNNHPLFVRQCTVLHEAIRRTYGIDDTTKGYWSYNLFNVSCSSLAFYKLWKELSSKVREYVDDDRPLWISSWLNFHTPAQVLDWHNHKLSIYHGYICIDPKNTVTEFETYKIENRIGQMYIGPSERLHRVVLEKNYLGERITIGFDVSDRVNEDHINSNFHAFMPIL